jgi:hypothetical protein
MPFAERRCVVAHGVLGLPAIGPRDAAAVETFVDEVGGAFPTVLSRQVVPSDAPPTAPHLVLQSTSSQLAVTGLQADFQVRFYGGFETDFERCRMYIRDKMSAILRGWQAIGAQPSFAGLILTLQFPFNDASATSAVEHVLAHHVRPDVPAEVVNDAKVQLTLRLADHYFVSLTVANYEAKQISRPLLPGATGFVVAPWEGEMAERGVELAVDVNNRYKAVRERRHPVVDDDELMRTLDVAEGTASGIGKQFAETGAVDVSALVEEVA